MSNLTNDILAVISNQNYVPLKIKGLARKLHISESRYPRFRDAVTELVEQGRIELAKNRTLRPIQPHGTVAGIYRRTAKGTGYVRPHAIDGKAGPEIRIREDQALDAVTGDEVLVKIARKPQYKGSPPTGVVLRVLARATRQFVGTYFERDGVGLVRIDSAVFAHSVYVGDPGAKGARPDDKVVVEMLRFPSSEERGEGVISEVLGGRNQPGVDTLSIIRQFGLPDAFPPEVLEEAREVAAEFDEKDLQGREDLTGDVIVTIDPVDARDFDDAISLTIDPRSKHWQLGVHIADVAHFVPPGSALDREARKRGTSVYLPQRVLPMFPEVISNGLASLQQGKVRFVKSVFLDLTPAGQVAHARFANAAIRNRKRFTYEQVTEILEKPQEARVEPEVLELLLRMRELALILRKRRHKRGTLELDMPEAELDFDDHGRVSGAHFVKHDLSHQIIEEFMLSANEAVAGQLESLGVPFLRRVHPAPEPTKLEAFAGFARSLGYKVEKNVDRFSLQRILEKSADRPDSFAVHYALLRSLKQAVYSPQEEEHYALATDTYCHFTSPIRRYPDLTVHRQIGQFIQHGHASADATELAVTGEHCSKTERRADQAERELIKVKLLSYMSERIGEEYDAIITGVADYGFFAQVTNLPVEGLVHISTLPDDYYYYDDATHTLQGRRTQRRFRLGDRVRVNAVRVDLYRRQLDFRVVTKKRESANRERHRPE